ncbi:MAG TPA: acetate uptake transporter [Acidimicrobiales bacterium]|nr:acetate uptake transporter [Acidimicrobiales bacterium]
MSEHKVADPGPLGLAGFAMTTFLLSCTNAGLFKFDGKESAGLTGAVALALFYGGIAQFAAGMWEFVRKNTFGALAFTSYGAFWLSFYAILKFNLPMAGGAVGAWLLAWTIFTLYMTIAAAKTNTAIFSVFVVLVITFVFLTLGNWNAGHANLVKIGGWLGILTAILAWYASMAGVVNETWGRTVFPVGPRS